MNILPYTSLTQASEVNVSGQLYPGEPAHSSQLIRVSRNLRDDEDVMRTIKKSTRHLLGTTHQFAAKCQSLYWLKYELIIKKKVKTVQITTCSWENRWKAISCWRSSRCSKRGYRSQTAPLGHLVRPTSLTVLASNSHRCDKPCRKDNSCSGFSRSRRAQRIVWREVNTGRRKTTAAKLRGLKYAASMLLAARHFVSYSPLTVILVTARGTAECLRILSIQKDFRHGP